MSTIPWKAPEKFVITRVPIPAWVELGPSFDALRVTPDPFGEEIAWAFAYRWVFRILASPLSGEPMLEAPKRGDAGYGAHAYWSALLNLLIYSFGWPRPDRGLRWWYEAGKPITDPRFQLTAELWDQDGQLDWFAAWLWTSQHMLQWQLRFEELVGYKQDETPVRVEPHWLRTQREAASEFGLNTPLGVEGDTDELHLSGHVAGPLQPLRGTARLFRTDPAQRRAVLLLDSMVGWYRALVTEGGTLPELPGVHSWYVDVIVKPVGWLGTFRRSLETGLWFSGRHSDHMRGV